MDQIRRTDAPENARMGEWDGWREREREREIKVQSVQFRGIKA